MIHRRHWLRCLLIQVAYTIGWTAVSSELTYYTSLYGPEILLLLNVAYFVPSVPIMVLQTLTDTAFDRAFGIAAATAYRFVIGAACPATLGAVARSFLHAARGLLAAALCCSSRAQGLTRLRV